MKQGFNSRNKSGNSGKPAVKRTFAKTEGGGKRIGKSLPPKTASAGYQGSRGVGAKNPGIAKRRPVQSNEPSGNRKINVSQSNRGFSKAKPEIIRNIPKKGSSKGEIRLNRYIANAGICSRREADTYITAGMVKVNGKVVTELGIKVLPDDEVRFDGNRISAEKKVYLLLNKPKDFVTTTDDPHADKIVMDLVKNACTERIYPVGRLDRNTTGLLLLTNDGDLSKRLTHPSHLMKKIYQVSLDKPVSLQHMQQIADGIELEDGPIHADAISFINQEDQNEIGIEIHSGRNRIVRRIFEYLGYRVKKLDRVYYAGLTKKNLPRGKYRFLTEKEVQYLKMQ